MRFRIIQRHPLVSFVVLAYAASWAVWLPLALSGVERDLASTGLIVLGGFGPLLAVLFVQVARGGRRGLRTWARRRFDWRCSVRWYVVALLLPPTVALAVMGVGKVIGAPVPSTDPPPLLGYPLLLAFVFFLGGGQEEPGWRGFALPHLQSRHGASRASLILGLVWAGWHVPLFFSPASSQAGLPFWWYVVHTIAIAYVFTWLMNSGGGSVLPAMLLHAGLNAVASWIPLQADHGPPVFLLILLGVELLLAGMIRILYGPDLSSHGLVSPVELNPPPQPPAAPRR